MRSPTDSVITIRDNADDKQLLAARARVRANLVRALGERPPDDLELTIARLVHVAVEKVSSYRAVFYESTIIKKATDLAFADGALAPQIQDHPKLKELIQLVVMQYPLVSIGATGTFTSQQMYHDELEMIRLAKLQSDSHVLPEATVRQAIATKAGISDEQIQATLDATRSRDHLSVIEGLAGTGKSFTMEAVRASYEMAGYDVLGTAISWVAATVLQSSAKLKSAMSLAMLLARMEEKIVNKNTEYFHKPTLIIVDEAGMVDTVQMAKLLRMCEASRYPIKIILTGDTLQVTPVSAGAAMETIVAYKGSSKITKIRRQVAQSDRQAVKLLSERMAGKAVHLMAQKESFLWAPNHTDQVDLAVQEFMSYRLAHPDRTALVLASDNKTVAEINTRVRTALKRLDLIQTMEVELAVTDTREAFNAGFAVGDEVVLRGNNHNLPLYKINPKQSTVREGAWEPTGQTGVYNRNTGRIVGIRKCHGDQRSEHPRGSYDFIIDLAGDRPGRVIVNSETFDRRTSARMKGALPMTHNYATTVYASQGQTVDQATLVESAGLDFRTSYVALSRHRHHVRVILDENDLHNRLDKGKKSSKEARANPLLEKAVRRHRYTNQEMLQEVATTMARASENLTACLYAERARLAGLNNEVEDNQLVAKATLGELADVAPLSAELDNAVWESDLRATVRDEAADPHAMAKDWREGYPVEANSIAASAAGLLRLAIWLDDANAQQALVTLNDQIQAQRPTSGIWDLVGAEALADRFEGLAGELLAQVDARPELGQEILTRVLAGDSLSERMSANVEVFLQDDPVVDVAKVLNLDHPLVPTSLTRQSDVDEERLLTALDVIPLAQPEEAPAMAPAAPAAKGLFGRLLNKVLPDEPLAEPTVRSKPLAKQRERANPFPDDPTDDAALDAHGHPSVLQATGRWLRGRVAPSVVVPFLPKRPTRGQMTAEGNLDFVNIPLSPTADGSAPAGPSALYLQMSRTSGAGWWGRGRHNEPRIFARDRQGRIKARYALDGTCVAGNGFPPGVFNPHATDTSRTPMYVVPGPFEMAWLAERKLVSTQAAMAEGKAVDLASIPHLVWDAKDADYLHFAKMIEKRQTPVTILRAKTSPEQEAWARELQATLLQRFRIHAQVNPPLPVLNAEPGSPPVTDPEPTPAQAVGPAGSPARVRLRR